MWRSFPGYPIDIVGERAKISAGGSLVKTITVWDRPILSMLSVDRV